MKGVIYTPCKKTIDALTTAQLFLDHVWKRFGLPDVIISDRGPQFASKVFQEMCKLLKIDHRMSTVKNIIRYYIQYPLFYSVRSSNSIISVELYNNCQRIYSYSLTGTAMRSYTAMRSI